MPGDFRCDLTNACALYHTHCTRGYRAHRAPGIPCALGSEGKEISGKPRAHPAARSRNCVLPALRANPSACNDVQVDYFGCLKFESKIVVARIDARNLRS